MNRLPTDRFLVQCIFDIYEGDYPGKKGPDNKGENDPYLAIDVSAVAAKLQCSPELLFHRQRFSSRL